MVLKTLTIRLTFLWDDIDEMREYKISVPNALTTKEIINIFKKEHDILAMDDELSDIYGYEGRCPETLIKYICKKYHWNFEPVNFDLELTFE